MPVFNFIFTYFSSSLFKVEDRKKWALEWIFEAFGFQFANFCDKKLVNKESLNNLSLSVKSNIMMIKYTEYKIYINSFCSLTQWNCD